eukprot:TRINITY_DN8367_c0_g2_i1.p2 TRINITY_DN8367_c0_g2~~TRINITY_DN8367_c0_g2_i1.p2  ORF type:complete len:136 (+),score=25.18 TRINITY_DN8367_c0_g2_i1:69-476(+)
MAAAHAEIGTYDWMERNDYSGASRRLTLNADGTAELYDYCWPGPEADGGWGTQSETRHGTWNTNADGAIVLHVTRVVQVFDGAAGPNTETHNVNQTYTLPRQDDGTHAGFLSGSIYLSGGGAVAIGEGLLKKRQP